MPYIQTEEEKERELNMMRTPDLWPMWPRLPLKRPWDEYPDSNMGLLIHTDPTEQVPVEPTVYLINMFERYSPGAPKREYDSFEDLLKDGWVVD